MVPPFVRPSVGRSAKLKLESEKSCFLDECVQGYGKGVVIGRPVHSCDAALLVPLRSSLLTLTKKKNSIFACTCRTIVVNGN